MFEVVDVDKYDINYRYGTDWVTDYICETDEDIEDIDTLIEKVKQCNYNPCGMCDYVLKEDKIILRTRMF